MPVMDQTGHHFESGGDHDRRPDPAQAYLGLCRTVGGRRASIEAEAAFPEQP